MKLPFKFLLGAVLAAAATNLVALPLQRADVAGDPAWVAHLDCDGLRPTAIGRFILAEMDKPEAADHLASFRTMFGVDLKTQLHGLTLYGTGPKPDQGVLLVYADFDAERLVTLVKGAKEYQSTQHNRHVIHDWIDEHHHSGRGGRTYAAHFNNRILIFGQTEASVAAALDVLDRSTPSLASTKNFSQLGAAGSTSFIQAAARKMDLSGNDPHASMFRLSKLATLQIGETKDKLVGTIELEANDDEVAKQMLSVAQGLVSLGKLQTNNVEAARLADALTLKQEDSTIIGTLSLPTAEVMKVIQ